MAFTPIIQSDLVDPAGLSRAVELRCADPAEQATLTVTELTGDRLSFVLIDDATGQVHAWELATSVAAASDLPRATAVALCDRLAGRPATDAPPPPPADPPPPDPEPARRRFQMPPWVDTLLGWPPLPPARVDDLELRAFAGLAVGTASNGWERELASSASGRVVDAMQLGGRFAPLPVLDIEGRYTATTEQYSYRWWVYDHEVSLLAAFNPLRRTRRHRALRVRLGVTADVLSIQLDSDVQGPQPNVGSVGPTLGVEYSQATGRIYTRTAFDATRLEGPLMFGARYRLRAGSGLMLSRTLAVEGEIQVWNRWTTGSVSGVDWSHSQTGWHASGRLAVWLETAKSDAGDVPELDRGTSP